MTSMFDETLVNSYLRDVDVHLLLDKIQRFRGLNLKKLTDSQLKKEIANVISFNNRSVLKAFVKNFKKGDLLYRIRKIESEEIPFNEMRTTQDAWNPPIKYVKRQRLNKPHESLLYVCPDILTAIEETKTNETDKFALIIYEIIDDIKGTCIGISDNFLQYNHEDRLKMRIINDFLKEEFTRDVGIGTEHLYRISEIIAKEYFDLSPRDAQDAWVYPSVANKSSVNLCLRPEISFDKLELKGVQIISSFSIQDERINLKIDCVVVPDSKGNLNYYPIGSKEQLEVFPEISFYN